MNFIDKMLSALANGFNFIGNMLNRLMMFLQKPFTYIYYFFDGIFYFLYQVFNVVVKVITLFVALIQFFGALVLGFIRSIGSMLTVDFNAPVTYPSNSKQGIDVVLDLLGGAGVLDVVPLILLAMVWAFFVKKIIGLLGGEIKSDA